ncbi:MAG: UDP-glucose/GDP-mannose dehydrogenase family protein [Thermodesulfobacteriota bacterium]
MNICVIGTGYVGLVTGACFAEIGHRVICVDNDEGKIQTLNAGKMPIYEPYLENLVHQNRKRGSLSFSVDLGQGAKNSEVIFICVGTPPLENGEADLSPVEKVTREVAAVANSHKLVVEKSTVPVQTGDYIYRTLQIYCREEKGQFDVASNPEFLREGSAVSDFFHPDRIVIGVENHPSEEILRQIYRPILERTFNCPVHSSCPPSPNPFFLVTDVKSAELIKHASNSFLATKISFINAIAEICERVGADVGKVAEGMGLDPRIGKEFLQAGLGFGGFCFPKDLQAFVRIAEKKGYDFALLKEVEKINKSRIDLAIEKLKRNLWVLREKTIAFLGLAFKPQTDDIRFAPAIELIRRLLQEGCSIRAFDPQAMEKASKEIPAIFYAQNPYEVAEGAEALVLVTEWPEFLDLDWMKMRRAMARPFVLDGRNFLPRSALMKMGFEYVGMGMGK